MADSRGLSGTPTMGVEEEFLLVDSDGRLVEESPDVLALAVGASGHLHPELARCQVEAASTVFGDAEALLAQLRDSRSRLAWAAAQREARLLALGTPLLSDRPPRLSPDARYERMRDELGPALWDSAGSCGCHVHVALPDLASRLRTANHLRPWLPVLLALTANSPLFGGHDTGYASWRYIRWSRLPSACAQPLFTDERDYFDSVDALIDSGAALDRGMVYWDIRPSATYPTLEVRVSDVAATAEEAALLAVLVRGLVATLLAEDADGARVPHLPQEALRAHMWRAARDGLGGWCLDPASGRLRPARGVLSALVDRISPALHRSGDLRFVRAMVHLLDDLGGGAQRQRALWARRVTMRDFVDRTAEATVDGPFHAAYGGELIG